MKITIHREIISEAPAAPGMWTLTIERDLPAVPVESTWIELAPDWTAAQVRNCTYMADGSVLIQLRVKRTNSPTGLAEEHDLADKYGWQWLTIEPPRIGRLEE